MIHDSCYSPITQSWFRPISNNDNEPSTCLPSGIKSDNALIGCIRIQLWVLSIYKPRLIWPVDHCQRFPYNCLWSQWTWYARSGGGDLPARSLIVFEYNLPWDPQVLLARVVSSIANSTIVGCIRIQSVWLIMSMNQGICDSAFTESWFLLIANEDNELLRACPMVTNQLTRSTIVFEYNLTWDLEFSLARVVTSIANRHTGDCIRIQPLSLMHFWETRVMWPGYHCQRFPSNCLWRQWSRYVLSGGGR